MSTDVIIPNNFRKLCEKKKKTCDPYIIDKLRDAIIEISSSENPERLGEKKHGDIKDLYAYNLTREHRVLYAVERKEHSVTVIFKRVCDHKNAYGID